MSFFIVLYIHCRKIPVQYSLYGFFVFFLFPFLISLKKKTKKQKENFWKTYWQNTTNMVIYMQTYKYLFCHFTTRKEPARSSSCGLFVSQILSFSLSNKEKKQEERRKKYFSSISSFFSFNRKGKREKRMKRNSFPFSIFFFSEEEKKKEKERKRKK